MYAVLIARMLDETVILVAAVARLFRMFHLFRLPGEVRLPVPGNVQRHP
jgi:hypothetical protein